MSGIGKKKAKLLLSAMTLSELRLADAEELEKISGISKKDAANIYEYFKNLGNEG